LDDEIFTCFNGSASFFLFFFFSPPLPQLTVTNVTENLTEESLILKASHPHEMPVTKPLAHGFSSVTVMIDEMFVNNGLVGVFNATELIYAVKANKGGLDSLNKIPSSFCIIRSKQPDGESKYICFSAVLE